MRNAIVYTLIICSVIFCVLVYLFRRELPKQKANEARLDSLKIAMRPVLLKYKESKKSNDTLALRDCINQIGEAFPSCITKFDNYGRAGDIDSSKATWEMTH